MLKLILPLLFLALQSVLAYHQQGVCSLELQRGKCLEHISRWYYNKDAKCCLPFTFTGCGGNANSFETKMECEGTCGNICKQRRDTGPCKAHFTRYFFNTKTGQCNEFPYGGCRGNENNFRSFDECRAICQNECTLPSDTGLCKALIPRYYYNKKTGRCETFVFGGCGGNANNFNKKKHCDARCVMRKG